jgi:hypothetical protein
MALVADSPRRTTMPAEHRDNPLTRETVWRVFNIPEDLRDAVRQRRQALGQTVREFVAYTIETELPGLAPNGFSGLRG